MTRKLLSLLVILSVGTMVTSAQACDKEKKAEKTAAKSDSSKKCCGGCDPANCPHCGKRAELTAADDGRSEPCDKPCDSKAKLTKTDEKAPCGSKAKLTKTEDKGSPCPHAAKAKLTAAEADDKPCQKAARAESHEGCPIGKRAKAILTSLPSMKYRVGDEVTGCSKSAAKLAEANGAETQYVVGDETFTDQGEAMARLVKALEDEIGSMTVMQFVVGESCMRCPMTAKSLAAKSDKKIVYRVGGFDFECKEKAEMAIAAVKAALDDVRMAYKVGETVTHCNKTAGKLAKENGGKMLYVVGDEETPCAKTAQLKLDEAKVHAIVQAAAEVAAS